MLSLQMSRVRRVALAAIDRARRAAAPAVAVVLTATLAAGLTGCDRAPDRLLLPGTGERDTPAIASISGTVTVPGSTGALPAVKVWAFRDVDSTYVSSYTAIQVVGNYTDPVFSVGTTSVMQRLVGGAWVDSIYLDPAIMTPTAGQMEWKFVTNKNFDTPPDYGMPGAQVDGLVGTLQSGAGGPDGNLVAKVAVAGPYYATIDEKKLRYSIVPWDEGPVATIDRATGVFTVDQLKDGVYIIVLTGPGLLTRRLSNIQITGGAGVDVGTVSVRSATTAITGRVGFSNNPDPLPTTTVQLLPATGEFPLTEVTTTDAFAFSGIENGAYRVRLKAPGYADSTVAVAYNGAIVDLGTIVLSPGFTSTFNTIAVIGDFPGISWDPAKQVNMTQVAPGVWSVVVPGITGGCHYFKFRTNDNWESPDPDYGGTDPLEACVQSLTGPVISTSTLNKALQVEFPAGEAAYKFTLNEQALTYAIEPVVVVTPGTLTGTVSFSGTPPAGFKAYVQVLEAGSGRPTASDSTVSRFTFSTLAAGDYRVRFSAKGYLPDTIDATVTAGQTTDVGNTTLISGYISAFTRIAVIGDFPTINWSPDNEVALTQVSPGVWRGTVSGIPGGDYYMKFRTNGDWENPPAAPDYTGTDVNETLQTSLTGPVMLTNSQFSGALHIRIPQGSQNFEFTLDEQNLTYSIVEVVAGQKGRVVR